MFMHTVLIAFIGSIFAAPQFYYSNVNPKIASRNARSPNKKCPSGFMVNAINQCVQPVIERNYFLFESPKVPISQPNLYVLDSNENTQYGRQYPGSNQAAASPVFFLVQPQGSQNPFSGVNTFSSYPSTQSQQSNSLFLKQVIPNLQKNRITPQNSILSEDFIDDSAQENELLSDYIEQNQPLSAYQPLNENLLKESRQEIDKELTKITSFYPPSSVGHHTEKPALENTITFAETSSLLTGVAEIETDSSTNDILSSPDTKLGPYITTSNVVEQTGTLIQEPSVTSSSLPHINRGVNSITVEKEPPVYKSAETNFFTIPGTKSNTNDILSSHEIKLEQYITTNKGVGQSGSLTQEPSVTSSTLPHIDRVINSKTVEEETSVYKSAATNFFTIPGTKKHSGSRTPSNKEDDNRIFSKFSAFQGTSDNTEIRQIAETLTDASYSNELTDQNEDSDTVISVSNERLEDSYDLRLDNEEANNDEDEDFNAGQEIISRPLSYETLNKVNDVKYEDNNEDVEVSEEDADFELGDQTAQESVASKNSAKVQLVQSESAGFVPAFSIAADHSRGNINRKGKALLNKSVAVKNNYDSFENLRIDDRGYEINRIFDHIRSNITRSIADPENYKGFVYIVADEGKEIVYGFN